MKSLWNPKIANDINDPLELRVYTSRLLGSESSLVLHGGGNTSVKINESNLFGEPENYLYVKGSGWDLGTIKREGFSAVRLDVLLKMSKLKNLSDTDMVKAQKAAMKDPAMPAPSVEAILHALIPFIFVDHTHSDAVVALSNTKNGPSILCEVLGKKFINIPYVMPGFILAKTVAEHTQGINWNEYDGMILQHHGIFTFANSAKDSYLKMIEAVTKVEDYIQSKKANEVLKKGTANPIDNITLAQLRKQISKFANSPMIARPINTDEARGFSSNSNCLKISQYGTLTPDHILNTKLSPAIFDGSVDDCLSNFSKKIHAYFKKHSQPHHNELDTAPRWVLLKDSGIYTFGINRKRAEIVKDIVEHTILAWQWSENLGGWNALPEKDLFDVEYWDLEQAKLKVGSVGNPLFQGKIALVTGAASGIGKACVETLSAQGALVVALDINPAILTTFNSKDIIPMVCDVTNTEQIKNSVEKTIQEFGGLDLLISNAGTFPAGQNINSQTKESWQKTIEVNLNSHQYLLNACIPYLELGVEPAIVIIGSKNVRAPGPGAAAYSAAKAGLTQLARVAAIELASKGIRINVIHPNAVFDTGIWTEEVLKNRSQNYGISIDEYKRNNLLKVEITSNDVANLAAQMLGPVYAKITGSQISIDGGNERTL